MRRRAAQMLLACLCLLTVLNGWGLPKEEDTQVPGDGTRQVPVRIYNGLYQIKTKAAAAIDRLFLAADSMMYISRPAQALQYLKQADSLSQRNIDWQVPVLLKTALIYEQLNDYKKATAYNFKALELVADEKDAYFSCRWEAGCYINIGWLQRQAGNNVAAENYVNKALELYKQVEVPNVEKINALLLEAHLAKVRSQYAKVNRLFREVRLLVEVDKDNATSAMERAILNSMEFRIYNNIADTYLYLQQPDSTLYWLKKTEHDITSLPPYVQALIYMTKGQAYARKHTFDSAVENLQYSLNLSQKYGYNNLQMEVDKEMLMLYTQKGDLKKSWYYQAEYIRFLEKEIATIEKNIYTINNQEANYYLSNKNKEIANKELQLKVQQGKVKERNLWTTLLCIGICSLIGLIYGLNKHFVNKKKLLNATISDMEKSRRIVQIEAGIKGEEKERKRIAMELHDSIVSELMALKINLEAVANTLPQLKQQKEYQYALTQSEDVALRLRETAHNLMPVQIREHGLAAALRNFLDNINTEHIHFTFQQYGQLPQLTGEVEKIIYLIVLELIQNIVKHSNASEALVQLHYFDNMLNITVEDNGVGIDTNKDVATEGIGLSNIREQLTVLNGTIDIQGSEYTGTTVLIELPFISDEREGALSQESYNEQDAA